jgi:tRNA(Ile)-lysidine synthase
VLSAGVSAQPLSVAELGGALDRLARFERAPFVAVAVSGGPDSLALAILADRWARSRRGEICALSVDHRLRPESGAEIVQLGGWLSARKIRHEVLVWDGKKPATGIQEAAREARYRLIVKWCHEHGCLHLLTAHHREDQAETHLIRRAAHSGDAGLAGMSAVRELDCCRILRPLLGIPKVRLAATLAAEGQPFIDDPSNRDPAFARAHLRTGAMAAPDGDPAAVLDAVGGLGRERASREHARDALLVRAVSVHPAGFATLDCAALLAAPADIAEQALGAIVAMLGGGLYPPRRRRVSRLLRVLAGDADGGYTLAGCRFVAWRGQYLVLRELAAAAGPARILPGKRLVWDRRFEVALPAAAAGPVTLDYLAETGVAELNGRTPALARSGLPLLVRPILPALWDKGGIAAVPNLGYRREGVCLLPELVFRPVKSLSDAGFAVVKPGTLLMS